MFRLINYKPSKVILNPLKSSFTLNRISLRSSFKRFQSKIPSSANAGNNNGGKKPTGMKALMKEYGYSALGIYLGLSAIDLPLFYLLVHSMGKEEIEYYENKLKQQFGYGISDEELTKQQEINKIHESEHGNDSLDNNSETSWYDYIISQFSWTELAIAYGIHKSFIFLRVPLTAAVTPPIVKMLRNWGFKIGSQSVSKSASIVKSNIKDYTASSKQFGTKGNRKRKWFDFFF